jgi:hypothetical protein
MKIEVGNVVNSRGSGVFGRLIGFRNGLIYGKEYNWTHSAIITEVSGEWIKVHEALGQGFIETCYTPNEFSKKIDKGIISIGTVKSGLKDVKKIAQKYAGRGYGVKDIFHVIVFWIFGTKAKFLFTGAQNLICSEAVSRILYDASGKKINFEKEFGVPYDLIEPMHLWQSKNINWEVI